jgi:hypothetical protein
MEKPIDTRPTFIYVLKESIDGEVRYVGKTVRKLENRLSGHICDKTRSYRTHWIQSLLRDGVAPVIELIETVPYDQDWVEREKYWIKYYRDAGCNLVNATDGGEGACGRACSDETRTKMRIRTSKSIEKIRQRCMKPVVQYTTSGEFIRQWESGATASRELGIHKSDITRCCKGKAKSAGGFQWMYFHSGKIQTDIGARQGTMKPIIQYSLDGGLIREWDSAQTAGLELGIHSTSISACCGGRQKSAGGFKWEYITK